MSKVLVQVNEHAYIDPHAVDALVSTVQGTLVVLRSAETITIPGMEPEQVLEAFVEAMREVTDE